MRRPVEGGPMFRPSDRSVATHGTSRRTGLLVALVSTLALVGCLPAAASDVRIRHAYFGMHDATGSTSSLGDRKSTRLNSSHSSISYAVFCLKKKNKKPS